LKRLIQEVLILSEHCLALRETSGKLREEGKWEILRVKKMLGNFEPTV